MDSKIDKKKGYSMIDRKMDSKLYKKYILRQIENGQ